MRLHFVRADAAHVLVGFLGPRQRSSIRFVVLVFVGYLPRATSVQLPLRPCESFQGSRRTRTQPVAAEFTTNGIQPDGGPDSVSVLISVLSGGQNGRPNACLTCSIITSGLSLKSFVL